MPKSKLSSAAAIMGRKGGQVRCKKGFATLTPEERLAITRRAVNARWGNAADRCPCGVMTLKRAKARGRGREHNPGCEFFKRQ
ncbi:MAG: hypothetical protein ABFD89_00900 [Bryobacteraceae bacterium]